jgi:hypothetical protein
MNENVERERQSKENEGGKTKERNKLSPRMWPCRYPAGRRSGSAFKRRNSSVTELRHQPSLLAKVKNKNLYQEKKGG